MRSVEEVRKVYADYQAKKTEIERARAVLEQKQAEYKKIEDDLIAKYGTDYAKVLEDSMVKLESWIKEGQAAVPPAQNTQAGFGITAQVSQPAPSASPFG